MMRFVLVSLALLLPAAAAFSPSPRQLTTALSSTSLNMANDEDLLRWARSSRSAGIDDRVVELKRPLGLVLQQDDDGNVYVETVAPRGNAGRTGQVSCWSLDCASYKYGGLDRIIAIVRGLLLFDALLSLY
jgi:hypothetical protein